MFVPESCRAHELLIELRAKHAQIAVVVDEYGGTSGVVTMEDVLEEIVGNIRTSLTMKRKNCCARKTALWPPAAPILTMCLMRWALPFRRKAKMTSAILTPWAAL